MRLDISFGGGRKIDASLKGFTHKTDQPPDHGGEGSAPEPVDFFFVSIATCTANAVFGFCQARGISMDGLGVTARLEPNESGERVARIVHEIRLPAGFPEKYRAAVVRAAETCTVKRYLHEPPAIETVVLPAEEP